MPRSKLELYEAILEVLINGPLTFERIAFETSIGCVILGKRLDFLMMNSLVETRLLDEEEGYAITERGVAVVKTLNFQKYLERIASKLSLIDDAMRVISRQEDNLQEPDE